MPQGNQSQSDWFSSYPDDVPKAFKNQVVFPGLGLSKVHGESLSVIFYVNIECVFWPNAQDFFFYCKLPRVFRS